jgi:Uma2 family endonuclease
MHRTRIASPRRETEPEPTWDVAYLFPAQGSWTEEEYFALNGNYLVEFSDGILEVLPFPTTSHQRLVVHLLIALSTFATQWDLGEVLMAPLRVRLWRRKFREPDVVFMLNQHADRVSDKYWSGADLVMEVVSGDEKDRHRDLVVKREEYARAGISEYWIVDPLEEQITVLRLARKGYVVHGAFVKGTTATSHLLPGFSVDASETFARQVRRPAAAKGTRKPTRHPTS